MENKTDSERFSELYGKYYGDLYRVALGLMKDPFFAQDAVHDAFLKLMSGRSLRLRDDGKAKALLVMTVRSVCLDTLKKEKRFTYIDDLGFEPAAPFREYEPDTRELFAALPERLRATVTLRFLYGFGAKETAKLLGVKPSCVRSRIRLSRRMLKDRGYG